MAKNLNNNSLKEEDQLKIPDSEEALDELRAAYSEEADGLISEGIPTILNSIEQVMESWVFCRNRAIELVQQVDSSRISMNFPPSGTLRSGTMSAVATSKPGSGHAVTATMPRGTTRHSSMVHLGCRVRAVQSMCTLPVKSSTTSVGNRCYELNTDIKKIIEIVKPMLVEQAEIANAIQMWISLSMPRIEDGNNFGVAVQESAADLAIKVEQMARACLETLPEYYSSRAKLATQVLKNPDVVDYRRALEEKDAVQFQTLRQMVSDIRNNYANLLDTVIKNRDKIECPRDDDDDESRMVMF